jgi:hypothetical protein
VRPSIYKELVYSLTIYKKLRDAEFYEEVSLLCIRYYKIYINAAINPSAILLGYVDSIDMFTNVELRIHLKIYMNEVLVAELKIWGALFPSKSTTGADS